MTKSQNKPAAQHCNTSRLDSPERRFSTAGRGEASLVWVARASSPCDATHSRPLRFWSFGIWNFFGIVRLSLALGRNFGIWNLRGLGRTSLKTATALFTLAFLLAPTHAQTPPSLVVFVDSLPIVIAAPAPFVEVSRNLPDAFAQRSRAIAVSGRLLAWFIPAQALKENLLDVKPPRCRTLQIQVMRDMEPVRYDAHSFSALRTETLSATIAPQITESEADTLFSILNLSRLAQKPAGQKIFGTAALSRDSFTLCIALSTEGADQLGGRKTETSITCVTYLHIKNKILLLTVTAPDLTADELRNTLRLTREWLAVLRWPTNP